MCRFWAGGISSFPFSRAREYRLLRRLTFDVHKSKHKKNATFVLLMFMLMHIKGSAACAYAYFIV
jgi:hypothetical protein